MLPAFMLLLMLGQTAPAQTPAVAEDDFVIRKFTFTSGERLPELRIHYRTLGTPRKDAQGIVQNAVLIMHGTGGTGGQFTGRNFAGELFGPGQPLDATKYFIILPDDIGHGGSSKPSDGLRATFPRYGYVDMVTAEHRLVTEGLGVNRLRLVMGTSMGGMHTWMWGGMYPGFMDALMPSGCCDEGRRLAGFYGVEHLGDHQRTNLGRVGPDAERQRLIERQLPDPVNSLDIRTFGEIMAASS